MSTITPSYQLRINDPYQQRLFDFNTSDSRLYLSRTSNQLLRAFGNNIVLNNFNLRSITSNQAIAQIRLDSGLLIQDTTLVEVDDNVLELEFDVTPYEDSGKLIVHTHYQFLQTVEDNPFRIKCSYVDETGTNISPDGWDWSKDLIVLAIIEFTKDSNNYITQIGEIDDVVKSITIHGQTFYKRGFNPYESQNLDGYLDASSIVNTKMTISENDKDKQPLADKIDTTDSSIRTTTITPQPDSEKLSFTLENDNPDPGPNYNYSTDSNGVKGWFPSPFSQDASLLDGNFIDESFLVFPPLGQLTYDARGNISTIQSTLKSGEQLLLTHHYNTHDDLIQITATVDSTTIWIKYYTYNANNDVSGWSVNVF